MAHLSQRYLTNLPSISRLINPSSKSAISAFDTSSPHPTTIQPPGLTNMRPPQTAWTLLLLSLAWSIACAPPDPGRCKCVNETVQKHEVLCDIRLTCWQCGLGDAVGDQGMRCPNWKEGSLYKCDKHYGHEGLFVPDTN
ncbi:hypothetical protein MJO29_001127 [Puccinia striiformis f. sp. tritici]|nr:hypothetical protein MJO29_001127 [Puccinia striiformis f. sp. tritici]